MDGKYLCMPKMDEKYWIYHDYFIFKPEFDNPLDEYIEIIKENNITKLFFSDFNNLKICIQTNNCNSLDYNWYFIKSNFNIPLSN